MNDKNDQSQQNGNLIVGATVIGLVAIGVCSIAGSLNSLMYFENPIGAGAFAIAAALSFGQVLSCLVRS